MSQSVLVFTFGPVQGFIKEARRAGDLYAGSRMLADLAGAALQAISDAGGELVYPVLPDGDGEAADIPNKLVALVPGERAAVTGKAAEEALHRRWGEIADEAHAAMAWRGIPGQDDPAWQAIWRRQTARDYLWQCFWAAAPIESDGYAGAYRLASSVVAAAKRTRLFRPAEELGVKDSLSGMREALHRQGERSRDYWLQVSGLPAVTGALLRPEGRERLDAIGAIKRFWPHGESFPSTSTVAATSFLALAREKAPAALQEYRDALIESLGNWIHQVAGSADWPYDGDLLFEETLTPERLKASYGASVEATDLEPSLAALRALCHVVDGAPSPYYAVIVLDGDSMGERISKLLDEDHPRDAHQQFGQKLSAFSEEVEKLALERLARVIYNGGDDVLALAPAGTAIGLAHVLAGHFAEVTGATASAGIAIAHHLSPLGAVLEAARGAERLAKEVPDKSAVCVTLMRRGGEHTTARGRWDRVTGPLEEMRAAMAEGRLSNRFPYDVVQAAYSIAVPGPMLQAELKRLLGRRSEGRLGEEQAERLNRWAQNVPGNVEELARWLVIARFLAGEGGDEDAAIS